jgi:hypothetical protein
MPTTYPGTDSFMSELSDIADLPLSVDIVFDNTEYNELMRRTGLVEGESGTPVSAFNSSI